MLYKFIGSFFKKKLPIRDKQNLNFMVNLNLTDLINLGSDHSIIHIKSSSI